MLDPAKVFNDPKIVALARSVAEGDVAEVQREISAGADVAVKGAQGLTLPHFALLAKVRGPAVLTRLLRAGADPISRLQSGDDLPHYAAARDNADPEFLAVLLDAGVSPDLVGGGENNSLLDAAVSGRNVPVILLLLSRGANVNYNHGFVGTALHTALRIADYRIATILLEHGANPNLRDKQDPRISPTVSRQTPAEVYCRYQSGKRKDPSQQQVRDFEAMKAAFAQHGVIFPCGI